MARHRKLTAAQKQQRQDWITGTVGLSTKQEAKPTSFERLAKNIPESQWIQTETLCEFARQNKDRFYVPETFLNALRLKTLYSEEISAYSVVAGVVVPEPLPLQEGTDASIYQE